MLFWVIEEILVLNEGLEANDGIRVEVGIMFVKVKQRLGALLQLDLRYHQSAYHSNSPSSLHRDQSSVHTPQPQETPQQ